MTKTTRAVHFVLFLVVLLLLHWHLSGKWGVPTGDAAIWLHAGLLMLVVGMYWIEPFFTKPSDVVTNCLIVFVSVSTLTNPPLAPWWDLLRCAVAILAVLAFVIVLRKPQQANDEKSMPVRVVYGLVTRLGSARVLFSTVFVLALLSYFDLKTSSTRWFVFAWLAILLSKELRLDEMLDSVVRRVRFRGGSIGSISRFVEPGIVRFLVSEDAVCDRGAVVAFSRRGEIDDVAPLAVVTGYRRGADSLEAECLLITPGFKEGALDDRTMVVQVNPDSPSIKPRLSSNPIFLRRSQKVGFATRESNISKIQFEVTSAPTLEEGHLVLVNARNQTIYYQIIDATLKEEPTLAGSERSFTTADAEQLGLWNGQKRGFDAFSWVAPENAPVFHVTPDEPAPVVGQASVTQVGVVPSSAFPVNINLSELVLFHSAILGVTGTGKSFLAFDLIEKAAASGIKVLCLDVTGDYKRHLGNAVLIKKPGHIKSFLSSADGINIGIIEFTENVVHPIRATAAIALRAREWCEENRAPEDFLTPRAKVFLVMEEAHILVPEFTFNPEKTLQTAVNQTAQTVLQARKYGLGFCVIAQRTANVTKSILNQCNTIFSFQAFDETGFDFLRNYMGQHYVAALPNLRQRHGVLVGKASRSSKPLIVRFSDQARQLQANVPPDWQPLAGDAAGADGDQDPVEQNPEPGRGH